MIKRTFTSLLMLALAATTSVAAQDAAEDPQMRADIAWLTDSLQGQEYYVETRGAITGIVQADESARLEVNSEHLVDAYELGTFELAASVARQMAGAMPYATIFVEGNLVVVNHDSRALTLRQDLREMLGDSL